MGKKTIKVVVGVVLFLIVSVGSIKLYAHYQEENNKESKPIATKATSEKVPEVTSERSKEKQEIEVNYDDFLQDFGEKFLNYPSIDERNKSVRDMFTGEARAINNLDTSVDMQIEGKGKVQAIYRQTTDELKYVIVGTDEANGNKNIIVLFVELTDKNGETKISQLTVSYARQAY